METTYRRFVAEKNMCSEIVAAEVFVVMHFSYGKQLKQLRNLISLVMKTIIM